MRTQLSRGRALDVYDVWSEERGCLCIVKTLRPDRLSDRSARRRLMTEARLLLSLTHPHIVRAYELLQRPQPALVLETLTGATLAYIVKSRRRRIPLRELAVLGSQLAAAVEYIHRHGYLHLDLKPSNVVCEDGLAKLIDLSVAHAPGRTRAFLGTRPYMSPEQARRSELTATTDAWGLGTVLFEAATGRRPFQGRDGDGATPSLNGPADSVRALRRLPRDVADLVDACFELDPADRPAVSEIAEVLTPLAG